MALLLVCEFVKADDYQDDFLYPNAFIFIFDTFGHPNTRDFWIANLSVYEFVSKQFLNFQSHASKIVFPYPKIWDIQT